MSEQIVGTRPLDVAAQTITGAASGPAPTRSARPHIAAVATVMRTTLRDALEMLATREASSRSAHVRMWSGAVEITRHDAPSGYWETAVVPATGWRGEREASGLVDVAALTQRVASADGETVQLHVMSDQRLVVAAAELAVGDDVPAPPRPDARSVLPLRVTLPKLAIQHIALRLPGPHLWVPDAVAQAFTHRRVSIGSVYEVPGSGWYLSGVVDGRPMLVLTGAVGVY